MKGQGSDILEDQRVYCIAYRHDGNDCIDVVGDKDRYGGETVLVILRTRPPGPTLVCTANRGVVRGGPILAPGDAVTILFGRESEQPNCSD